MVGFFVWDCHALLNPISSKLLLSRGMVFTVISTDDFLCFEHSFLLRQRMDKLIIEIISTVATRQIVV